MLTLLLADSTFQFSVGAIVALGAIAAGYGMLRNTVQNLKKAFEDHEQTNREDFKEHGKQIRDIERWQDRTKGAERAKRGHSPDETTITRSFSKDD